MLDIYTEARKHFGFFLTCASILLGIFVLREYMDSYKSVLDVIWVFAVVLVSSGATFCVSAQIFMFLVLKRDTLLHLSTHSQLRKFIIKTSSLSLGFIMVGIVSLLASTTTWPEDDKLTKAVAYAVGAKLLSGIVLVSLTWVLGVAAAHFKGFYARLLIFMGGLTLLIGSHIAFLWRAAKMTGTTWAIGGSTSFAGYPVYCGPLAISIGTPFSFSSKGPYVIGIALNLVWVLLGLLFILLQSHRRRTHLRVG